MNSNTIQVLWTTIAIRSPSLHILEAYFLTANELDEVQVTRLENLEFTHPSTRWDAEDVSRAEISARRKTVDEEETGECLPFNSLKKFEILDPRQGPDTFTLAQALGHGIKLLQLVELTCWPVRLNSDQMVALMDSIHLVAPNLQKIVILDRSVIPGQAIRMLLKCRALVALQSEGDVDINLEDIITIATDRSSWKVVHLPSSRPLSHRALVPFAQNCSELVELVLTLDSSPGLPDLSTFTTNVRFASLTLLQVGFQPSTTSEAEVALFLSSICESPLKIYLHRYGRDVHLWSTVDRIVNTIIKARLENLSLKKEIALLRSEKTTTIP
ncbi:hypothetical protein Clacol_002057 [Clathrus columnatus]|uniref:Uncharacterized protein n=1 Tax=Clathrus columnatus TaxID=1419009 RepID=A0AAV5A5H8_9AGAM|nr:hypothetical protein Clacol_002057 [Clathrus columnatus]